MNYQRRRFVSIFLIKTMSVILYETFLGLSIHLIHKTQLTKLKNV